HGQYATNNYPRGIRRFPYSNDPQVFPLTYKDVALRTQVHAIGEIWCNTLMEMRAVLINRYGFQEGQRLSLQLVVDGLKLTPRSPTFIDARNAILLADRVNNGSANQCLLWQAFAKRGLGFAATTTDASDGAPEESLAIAPYCSDAASIRFDKGSYISNETVRFWLSDRNATGTQRVTLTSSVTGDQENLTLTPEATVLGSFTGAIKLAAGRFRANDGVLQGSVGVADQIVVTYADANNGSDPATVRATVAIAREKSLFDDTIENGNQGWLPTGTWAVTNSRAASPIRSWTDSPAGIYANFSNTSLTSPLFDLSGLGEVILSFSHSYDIEQGFDFGIVEFSTDDGASWKRAVASTGTQSAFTQSQVRLRALDGQARARIRFRLTTDNIVTADGWYVDDIRLTGRSTSPAVIGPDVALSPTITGISPAFGSPAGGTRVTILGSSFTETPDTTVFFDNLPATSVSVVSGNVISAVAPPHAAGPVAVRVGNRYGGVSLVKGFTYFVTGSTSGAPVVTNIYPAFGSIRGGTVVTMIGSNLTPETVVTFGAARGAATFVNANTLRVVSPAATAVGATDVNVANGASLSTLAGGFNFINPTPPVVDTILPGGGETIYAGGTINIRWRSSDNRSVARHSLAFRRVTGTGFALTDIAANIEGSAQSFAWTIPAGLTPGEGRIRVIATDDEGTETEAFSDANFTVARRWETSVSLPAPLGSFAAVSDGQNLYRIGGLPLITGAVPTATVQKLNPAAATPVWTDVAPLPTGLSLPDAVFLRGKIYVPGGSDSTGARLTTHFVYDVASNAWTTQASSPLGISSYVLAVDEARGVYYQTGGFNATSGRVSFVRMFNPATNAWSDLPPLLTARNFHEATLIDGKLYVAGGIGNTGALDSAEVYDFTTRQWTPIAPMNRPRSLATSFVTKDPAGNALWFVVGGNDTATGALLGAEVYDVRNNRWITLDGSFGLPTPRSVLSGAIVGGYFYAYGSNAAATGTANERFKVDVVSPIPLDPVPPALAVPPTQIAVAGLESRFDITANDLGSGSPITLTASGLPAGADFTTNTETNNSVRGEFRWTPTAADNGKTFAVSFTASDGQLSDTKVVNIRVVEASRLAAVNSADFRLGPIAPDSVASIFGTNLAVRTESATILPLPRELAGTTVTVNGVRAALFVVSPSQINFAVPPGISLGAATIIVANQAGSYAAGTVEIAATAPALFTLNSTGTGDAWASATVDGINYQLPPFDVTVAGRPNILVLNGTGIRRAPATNPNDNDGVAESVTATIGGRAARVLYAGAQGDFTGLDQLNIEIPAGLAGGGPRRVEVIITVNGVAANRVMIQLK
ncbi:MAG: M36 family metallopeptidase, partial [Acidobacteriota bacterium]